MPRGSSTKMDWRENHCVPFEELTDKEIELAKSRGLGGCIMKMFLDELKCIEQQ